MEKALAAAHRVIEAVVEEIIDVIVDQSFDQASVAQHIHAVAVAQPTEQVIVIYFFFRRGEFKTFAVLLLKRKHHHVFSVCKEGIKGLPGDPGFSAELTDGDL